MDPLPLSPGKYRYFPYRCYQFNETELNPEDLLKHEIRSKLRNLRSISTEINFNVSNKFKTQRDTMI